MGHVCNRDYGSKFGAAEKDEATPAKEEYAKVHHREGDCRIENKDFRPYVLC